jgi:DNA polymerase I
MVGMAFLGLVIMIITTRVAELVTATGRSELSLMQDVARSEYGLEIIYGDTDSLFLNNTSKELLADFQNRFSKERKIELEIKNNYQKLLVGEGKKHYIGYENGKLDPVGFEGGKSDRPEYFHLVYSQLLDDIFKHEIDPIPNVRKAFADLEANNIDKNLLKISKVLSQNPEEYNSQSCQAAEIGKALGRKQGDLIEYYSSNKKITGKSWTLNPADIDIAHYKALLWNTISEILEIAGHSVDELAEEFDIKSKPKRIIKSNSIGSLKRNNAGGESA